MRYTYKLSDLGSVGRGKSRHRPRDDARLYGGKYPFFQTGDVKAANLYLSKYTQTYNDFGLAQSKLWKPGTLCITIAANIADTAILAVDGCFPDSVVGFIANPKKADAKFIKYYLDAELKLKMQNISKGTTQDNLSLDKLLSFDFLCPDLPTQRKIAAVLSAYDDLIENNARRVQVLEEMARALYREWFVEFRFPGHDTAEFVEDTQGRRPEGWERVKVGDYALTQYGLTASTISSLEGTRFLRGMDFNKQSYIDWSQVPASDFTGDDRKYKLKRGDLLLIRMADPGKVGVVEQDIDAVFASYIVRVKLDPAKFTTYYGFHLFLSEEYRGYINGGSTGTTRKSASASVLTGFDIALPPMPLQMEFERHIEIWRAAMRGLVQRNANLRRTRDLLLPRLVSGELDVSALNVRGLGLETEEQAREEARA